MGNFAENLNLGNRFRPPLLKDKTRINAARHAKIVHVFVFACVVGKNLKTPTLSPLAEDAIIQGSIRGLGSPLYICAYSISNPSLKRI